jgi:catechol 2,3-dioxygenase-like lactoylglutathione lyase family enzyme
MNTLRKEENKIMTDTSIAFDHVHLISKDPESAASWYAEMLGGKIMARQQVRGAPQFVVAFEGTTILVRGQRPGEEPGWKGALQWGTDHFGFHVQGDFDGYCGALKKKGVRFTLEPVDFSPKVRIAFIEAPDGQVIELLQRRG